MTELEKEDPELDPLPQYWVKSEEVNRRTYDGLSWQIGIRQITNTTNERTTIVSPLPLVAFGNKVPLIRMPDLSPVLRLCWVALASSFALDFASRQKLGALTYNQFYLKQLPFPKPEYFLQPCLWNKKYQYAQWYAARGLELCYTTGDLTCMATDVGFNETPFPWDISRRSKIRKELDAACFIAYGISPEDANYILSNTFPLFRRFDEEQNDGKFQYGLDVIMLMKKFLAGDPAIEWLGSQVANGWLPKTIKTIYSDWHKMSKDLQKKKLD